MQREDSGGTMHNSLKVIHDVPQDAGGIWPIVFLIPGCFETIAPERVAELKPLLKGTNFHLANEVGYSMSYNPETSTLKIPRSYVDPSVA